MANLKLIKVTGKPFSDESIGKIGIQRSNYQFDIIREGRLYSQDSSYGNGWEYATAEEIAENWKLIYPHWTPEVGDNVIVTQDYCGWVNCKGTIIAKDNAEDYYRVESETGRSCIFNYTLQMILAPYSETKVEPEQKAKPSWKWQDLKIGDKVKIIGETSSLRPVGSIFAIDKMEAKDYGGRQPIRLVGSDGSDKGWPYKDHFEPYYGDVVKPKEETVSIRFLTEQQFKDKGLWAYTYPKGWNSDGHMNEYLGQSVVIPKSIIESDGTFRYQDWTFKVTDYIITEGVSSRESIPTPVIDTKPEKPPRKFNVGDRVTYKSLAQCGGDYKFGGSDQGGFVGTVESESGYDSDKGCYSLRVTCRDGFCYNMLESEFCEYDGTTMDKTLHIHKTTTGSFTLQDVADGTLTSVITPAITPTFSGHVDPLSSYKQKPITIKQKPKTKLTII